MNLVNIAIGFAVLLLGRKVFWVFVAGVGFALGATLARQLLGATPEWQVLVMGLVCGGFGALCAIVFERAAVAVVGFFAGAAFAMRVMDIAAFHPDHFIWIWSFLWLVSGVLGAVMVTTLFDWALIVLSSVVGAGLVTDAIAMRPAKAEVVFAVLLVLGIVVQARRRG